MRRSLLFVFAPFALAGCITSRLDEANARAASLQKALEEIHQRLRESEAKVDEANQIFLRMEGRMTEMDRKMGTVETGFRRMFGIKGQEEE